MEAYEQLRELLDASPTGAPASPAFDRILRLLFTPEEAALAVHLTLFPRPLSSIAHDSGLSMDAAQRLLEAMADKAVIFCQEKGSESSTTSCRPSRACSSSPSCAASRIRPWRKSAACGTSTTARPWARRLPASPRPWRA